VGWGKTNEADKTVSKIPYKAEFPFVDASDCKSVYGDSFNPEYMHCAGEFNGKLE